MKVGDKVQWTHIRDMGTTIKMYAWEGDIVAINGDRATVKHRGRTYDYPLHRLRPIDARGELTELIMGKEPPKGDE